MTFSAGCEQPLPEKSMPTSCLKPTGHLACSEPFLFPSFHCLPPLNRCCPRSVALPANGARQGVWELRVRESERGSLWPNNLFFFFPFHFFSSFCISLVVLLWPLVGSLGALGLFDSIEEAKQHNTLEVARKHVGVNQNRLRRAD